MQGRLSPHYRSPQRRLTASGPTPERHCPTDLTTPSTAFAYRQQNRCSTSSALRSVAQDRYSTGSAGGSVCCGEDRWGRRTTLFDFSLYEHNGATPTGSSNWDQEQVAQGALSGEPQCNGTVSATSLSRADIPTCCGTDKDETIIGFPPISEPVATENGTGRCNSTSSHMLLGGNAMPMMGTVLETAELDERTIPESCVSNTQDGISTTYPLDGAPSKAYAPGHAISSDILHYGNVDCDDRGCDAGNDDEEEVSQTCNRGLHSDLKHVDPTTGGFREHLLLDDESTRCLFQSFPASIHEGPPFYPRFSIPPPLPLQSLESSSGISRITPCEGTQESLDLTAQMVHMTVRTSPTQKRLMFDEEVEVTDGSAITAPSGERQPPSQNGQHSAVNRRRPFGPLSGACFGASDVDDGAAGLLPSSRVLCVRNPNTACASNQDWHSQRPSGTQLLRSRKRCLEEMSVGSEHENWDIDRRFDASSASLLKEICKRYRSESECNTRVLTRDSKMPFSTLHPR